MQTQNLTQPLCRSVFQNGMTPTRGSFTKVITALINWLEKQQDTAEGRP